MAMLLFEKDVLKYTFYVGVEDNDPDTAREKAQQAIKSQFDTICNSYKPDEVNVDIDFVEPEANYPSVSAVREKIEDGSLTGQIVTIQIEITAPNRLPLPNSSWLTVAVRDEPSNGLIFLTSTMGRIPVKTAV